MAMQLSSPAFAPGGRIDRRYTCDGDDTSPALRWSGVPENCRSLMVTCHDPDAPSGLFRHWAAFEIPAEWAGLDAGHGAESLADGFRQAVNDFGRAGYGGPCPPPGHGEHHYHFRLWALSEASLPVAGSATCVEVEAAAEPYVLAEAELVGIYGR